MSRILSPISIRLSGRLRSAIDRRSSNSLIGGAAGSPSCVLTPDRVGIDGRIRFCCKAAVKNMGLPRLSGRGVAAKPAAIGAQSNRPVTSVLVLERNQSSPTFK